MEYTVRLTAPAEADAHSAYEYIRNQAPAHADRWFHGLFQSILSLRTLPARCPLAPEAEEFQREIRQLLYGRRSGIYRILFDIEATSEAGPTVRVLRIWHSARDRVQPKDLEGSE